MTTLGYATPHRCPYLLISNKPLCSQVELTSRTGRNPQYSYVQLGCSKRAEQAMLAYAKTLVGKPFSNSGMARSIVYPRTTTGESFFCAELVAAVLKKGGLMSSQSNPGAATPQSLHRLYKNQAAATANPYTLRQFAQYGKTAGSSKEEGIRLVGFVGSSSDYSGYESGYASSALTTSRIQARKRSDFPPRASFRCVSGSGHSSGGYVSNTALFLKR